MRTWLTALVAFVMAAHAVCADELKIDGTSEDSLKRSVAGIVETLSPEDRETFQAGMVSYFLSNGPLVGGPTEPGIVLHGMSKAEVLEIGRKAMAGKNGASKRVAATTIDASDALSCLQQRVTISDAHIERGDFSKNIRLTVTNGLSWPIAFVHVGYKVTTPGRSVPWSDKKFGMGISGGIEPGETRTISTTAFNVPDLAKDAVVTAEILDVADAERRQLIGKTKYNGNAGELSPLACKGDGE